MSCRQTERASRFATDVDLLIRVAGSRFRDNDPDQSARIALGIWWGSRIRGHRFVQLLQESTKRTSARVSLGTVKRGEPGQREAMPYFFAILRDLVAQERRV
jgi:hypothetical protein